MKDAEKFENLVAIMARLRDPERGCPWDLDQTYGSLRGYLLEECYEALEALDAGDRDGLCEELGDLLFQIVFLSQLAAEEGAFRAADVVRGIAQKMVRRHPHVFGDASVEDAEHVLRNWEEIKQREKTERGHEDDDGSILGGIPRGLPALLKAQRLGSKAARVGFDWPDAEPLWGKVDEELGELRQAAASGSTEKVREELGDLLFTLVNLARHLKVDPEQALESCNVKFRRRFEEVERLAGESEVDLGSAGIESLDTLWERAKRRIRREP